MITKHLYIDAWNPAQLVIDATQGEVSSRFVVAHLFNNGVPIDLTDSIVSVYGTKPDGKLILNSCEILDAANGVVSVPMSQQMSIAPGEYSDSGIQIIKGDSLLKIRAFRIIVWPAADYDGIEESTDEFGAVNEALRSANVANSRIDTLIALPEGATTGDAELADIRVGYDGITYNSAGEAVRSQVAEQADKIGDMSRLTTPAKNTLVDAINEAAASGGGSGLTGTASSLLMKILRGCAYTSDQSENIVALETVLGVSGDNGGDEEPDEPTEPDEPDKTLDRISATYSGGNVVIGTDVSDLSGIVVTAHYSDGTSESVTGYTLSGTIEEGENTVTISYLGKSTSFIVVGVSEVEIVSYTVTNNLTNASNSNTSESVNGGSSYTAVLMPAPGYVLGAVTVTMGGVDVTAEAVSGRRITIAAVTGDIHITAEAVADTRTLLHHWDLTQSLTDTVGGAAITLNGATQDANGLTLGSAAAYATLDEAVTNRKEVTIEVDFGDMSRTGTAHGRLLMATDANGFIYRNTGSWQIYMDRWSGDTLETDANAFANSTLVIKQSGDFSNSSSGSHYWTVEHNGKVIVEKARAAGYGLTLKLGSSANSYYTAVIKAIRVYEGAA